MNQTTSAPFVPEEGHPRFPLEQFIIAVMSCLALTLVTYRLFAPDRLSYELGLGLVPMLKVAFLFGIPLSLFEYLYHRYLLHAAVLPFMAAQNRAHNCHHGLTNVTAQEARLSEPHKLVPVRNDYPIERAEQEKSMMFPYWSLLIFYPVFGILLGIPAYLLFGNEPVWLGLLTAVTVIYCWYEVWHAILHFSYARVWQPLLYGRAGRLFRRVYAFHLMHHLQMRCNEAVVGFWGFAIWDYLFGTHRRPERLPLPGQCITFTDKQRPQPRWPISMLDAWQKPMERWSRNVEELGRYLLRKLHLMKPLT